MGWPTAGAIKNPISKSSSPSASTSTILTNFIISFPPLLALNVAIIIELEFNTVSGGKTPVSTKPPVSYKSKKKELAASVNNFIKITPDYMCSYSVRWRIV